MLAEYCRSADACARVCASVRVPLRECARECGQGKAKPKLRFGLAWAQGSLGGRSEGAYELRPIDFSKIVPDNHFSI